MKYISKKEVYQKINLLENAQDKFLFLAIYNGIHGKVLEDIINLKKTDINLDKKIIKNKNNIVHMDDTFLQITKRVLEEKEYYKKFNADFSNMCYKFNPSNLYVLKSKPSSLNNNGLNKMTFNAVKDRFRGCCELMKLDITTVWLRNSKLVDDLLNIKNNWRQKEVREFFIKYNIDASADVIYNFMKEVKKIKGIT